MQPANDSRFSLEIPLDTAFFVATDAWYSEPILRGGDLVIEVTGLGLSPGCPGIGRNGLVIDRGELIFEDVRSAQRSIQRFNPEGASSGEDPYLPVETICDFQGLNTSLKGDLDTKIFHLGEGRIKTTPFAALIDWTILARNAKLRIFTETGQSALVTDDYLSASFAESSCAVKNHDLIAGLVYFDNFFSPMHQQMIVEAIDSGSWQAVISRRVQQFGVAYDFRTNTLAKCHSFPGWLQTVIGYIERAGVQVEGLNQAIVQEYHPGMGINPHVDSPKLFGDKIIIASFCSPIQMDFKSTSAAGQSHSLLLQPGSLLVLDGEARYDWKHSIAYRDFDMIGDRPIPRQRRISLSLRQAFLNDTESD